ncbi:hypothetical protein BD413DRAFT_612428 [Trametes elegans]|nr:hypothetical protein BD413DRAFT_612428 [Trametes elegans]
MEAVAYTQLASYFPSLETLCLEDSGRSATELAPHILAFKSLRHLALPSSTNALDPYWLQTLLHTFDLESLQVHVRDFERSPPTAEFPQLRKLTCSGSWKNLAGLAGFLHAPSLDEVHVTFGADDIMDMPTLREFIRSLSQNCPHLRTLLLSITFHGPHAIPPIVPESIARLLEPCASLTELENIHLTFVSPDDMDLIFVDDPVVCFSFSEEELRAVARSLPHARFIALYVSPFTVAARAPSRALSHFARWCPHLERLHIPAMEVRAAELRVPTEPPTPNHPLRELVLAIDPTQELGQFPAFLDTLFPNLELGASMDTLHTGWDKVLRCVELFEAVLTEINAIEGGMRNNALHSLALVCKDFSEPASCVLWSKIPDLHHLYGLLVTDDDNSSRISEWDISRLLHDINSAGKRPYPDAVAWERFLHVAARVQSVGLIGLVRTEHDLLRELVARNSGRSFLPSLRSLYFSTDPTATPRRPSALFLLRSPAIQVLVMSETAGILRRDRDATAAPPPSLAGSLAIAFPSLQSFTAKRYLSNDLTDVLSDLARMAHIRSIRLSTIPGLRPEQVRKLLSGRLLEDLTINICDYTSPSIAPQTCIAALTLKCLTCRGTWADLASFPSTLSCPGLEKLHLHLTEHPSDSAPPLVRFDECVRAVCDPAFAPALRTLSILAQSYSGYLPHPPMLERTEVADLLAPVAALASLEDLEVLFQVNAARPRFHLDFSDEDAPRLAQAVAGVRRFSLCYHRCLDWTAPTLGALVAFARYCPRLVSLELPSFRRCAPVPTFTEAPPQCLSFKQLRMHADNPHERPDGLASFLDELFPNLDVELCMAGDQLTREAFQVWNEVRVLQAKRRLEATLAVITTA